MIRRLKLHNFKNFRDATLHLGPFSVLVGTNASGKSNVRDAVRVLHAIGRGYKLADIFGERWSEGGEKVWDGIRGGTREAAFFGASRFGLKVVLDVSLSSSSGPAEKQRVTYRIDVETDGQHDDNTTPVRIARESLAIDDQEEPIFDTHPKGKPKNRTSKSIQVWAPDLLPHSNPPAYSRDRPIIQQIEVDTSWIRTVKATLSALQSMRFFEFHPPAMRRPSVPGQTVLGDRGENLSSVLQAIHQDDARKDRLASWVRELTPMDVVNFEFPSDAQGRIQVVLVEKNGQKISANSASAGTLRLLGVIAAVLGPEHARLSFFEELENGIHPTRLHLLLQLIEQNVSDDPERPTQVVATTHSPQLLRFLSDESLTSASVVYRGERQPDATIVPVLDIPRVKEVMEHKDLGRLFESGWMENSLSFAGAGNESTEDAPA